MRFVVCFAVMPNEASEPQLAEVKPTGNAGLAVVVVLVDVAAQALEAVDLAPRRLPAAEVGLQLVRRALQRLQALRWIASLVWMKSTTGTSFARARAACCWPCTMSWPQ
jgi:hypothetical protein